MGNTNETSFLALGGEWVITVINQQLQCLMGHRKTILSEMACDAREWTSATPGSAITLDVSRVEALDASGCQLLASFVQVMRGDGVKAGVAEMPASFKELFESLGYHRALQAADQAYEDA